MLLLFPRNSFFFLFIFLAYCVDFKIKNETNSKNVEFSGLVNGNLVFVVFKFLRKHEVSEGPIT